MTSETLSTVFDDILAQTISGFHDQRLAEAAWPYQAEDQHRKGVWFWIEANHRFNCSLWGEEDLARRTGVTDSEIANNKRAIDRYNQQRNDAIEHIDEAILKRLEQVTIADDAWLNSETAGSMIDRLSIASLKIHHMDIQAHRNDVDQTHRDTCTEKVQRLRLQRVDLQYCLDTLLQAATPGRAYYRVYRQFKMYNDPRLNPYLSGMQGTTPQS